MQVISANRLHDGRVVYLTPERRWRNDIHAAWIAEDEATQEVLLAEGAAAVARAELIDPYLIEVRVEAGWVRPVRFREALRAEGPSRDSSATLHTHAAA